MRTVHRGYEGQSLLEVAVAVALLAVVLIGIALALSSSLEVMRTSKGQLVAHRAADATVESLRATPYAFVYETFWSDAGLQVTGVGVPPRSYVTGGDASGALASIEDQILAPAYAEGAMQPPKTGPALAIRFLGEDECEKLWGSPTDINLNGAAGDPMPAPATGSADPGYSYQPMLVQVRWRDDGGDQSFTLAAVLTHEAPLDPQRQ